MKHGHVHGRALGSGAGRITCCALVLFGSMALATASRAQSERDERPPLDDPPKVHPHKKPGHARNDEALQADGKPAPGDKPDATKPGRGPAHTKPASKPGGRVGHPKPGGRVGHPKPRSQGGPVHPKPAPKPTGGAVYPTTPGSPAGPVTPTPGAQGGPVTPTPGPQGGPVTPTPGPQGGAVQAKPNVKPLSPRAPACTLSTPELPRGGRLELQVDSTGKAPVVRIGGRVARMIERTDTRVAAQVDRKSNGGAVTLQRGKERLDCGSLTIIGLD